MNLNEVETLAFDALQNSVDYFSLDDAIKAVNGMLAQPWLNEKNTNKMKALFYWIEAKRLALYYLREGYDTEDLQSLFRHLDEMHGFAVEKSSDKLESLFQRLFDFFKNVGTIMEGADIQADRVRDSDWNKLTSNQHEAEEVRDWFAERVCRAEALPISETLFGNYAFIDAKGLIVKDLSEVRDFADNIVKDLIKGEIDRMLSSQLKPVSEEISSGTYFPSVSEREHQYANLVVVSGPFIDELELYAYSYSKQKGVDTDVLDIAAFDDQSAESIEKLFDALKKIPRTLVVHSMERFRGEMNFLYRKLLSIGKTSNTKVFIMDPSGDKQIYNAMMDVIQESSVYTPMDVASVYLRMPGYNELIALLESNGMLYSDDIRIKVKQYLPFMGYVGLNRLMEAYSMHRDWLEAGRSISGARHHDALRYLSRIPFQPLFIDTGWSDFKQGTQVEKLPVAKIDYDQIRDVNPVNIKKITQGNFTIFEKCGLICRYCLAHGEDVSIWQGLDDEKMSKRMTLATHLVLQILGVSIRPVVKILDQLDNSLAGGICIGGGKEIQYKRDCMKDFRYAISVICHESFHAFQHMAIESQWREWYWRELGVTRGRIETWIENCHNYFDLVDDGKRKDAYNSYRLQIFECDARAFASDCLLNSESAFDKITWE